jgi:hypothetical protein
MGFSKKPFFALTFLIYYKIVLIVLYILIRPYKQWILDILKISLEIIFTLIIKKFLYLHLLKK